MYAGSRRVTGTTKICILPLKLVNVLTVAGTVAHLCPTDDATSGVSWFWSEYRVYLGQVLISPPWNMPWYTCNEHLIFLLTSRWQVPPYSRSLRYDEPRTMRSPRGKDMWNRVDGGDSPMLVHRRRFPYWRIYFVYIRQKVLYGQVYTYVFTHSQFEIVCYF